MKSGEPASHFRELPTAHTRPSYLLAGVAGAAGVADAAGVAGVADFLACFLCFFVFTGAVVEGCSVVGFGLSAWAAKDRAAARAVPNINAVNRFILFISP